MTLPPFPDTRGMPDWESGGLLLGYFIAAQADDLGIPIDRIPEEFAERIRQLALTAETATAKNAAVEKALHKAAIGDFETAGKFLREHLADGAVALKFIPIGIRKSKQAAKFGREGAKGNKEEGAANRQEILNAAKGILAAWMSKKPPSGRRLEGLISEKTGIPLGTVRGHTGKLRKEKKLD